MTRDLSRRQQVPAEPGQGNPGSLTASDGSATGKVN